MRWSSTRSLLRASAQFYFFFYAAMAVFSSFFALWLTRLGLAVTSVVLLTSLFRLTAIVGPLCWSPWAMTQKRPGLWLSVAAGAAGLAALSFLAPLPVWGLAAATLAFGFFFQGALPQAETLTLQALGESPERYGHLRLWGSIGYSIMSLLGGALLVSGDTSLFVWMTAALMLGASVVSWPFWRGSEPAPMVEPEEKANPATWTNLRLLERPAVVWLLGIAVLNQMAFSAYYGYYPLYLAQSGHSGFVIGALLALGSVAEIAAFVRAPLLLSKVSPQLLIVLALLASVLRWLLIGAMPHNLPVLVVAQLLHALCFGVFHTACMRLIGVHFPGEHGGFGQGLFLGFSFGLGGLLGALLIGLGWSDGGGKEAFALAAGITALAVVWSGFHLHSTPPDPMERTKSANPTT